jgi:glycosyltransferase involved in cell wall biosynthesis
LLGRGDARIKFLYSISAEDVVALYNACSLFVYASLYEGGGLPVLEAMKCGAPVIASNSSSIPEYVGRSDCLFDPKDEEDIGHTIERVLSDEAFREALSAYGEMHSKSHTWDSVVARTLEAYRRATG